MSDCIKQSHWSDLDVPTWAFLDISCPPVHRCVRTIISSTPPDSNRIRPLDLLVQVIVSKAEKAATTSFFPRRLATFELPHHEITETMHRNGPAARKEYDLFFRWDRGSPASRRRMIG